LTEPQKDFDGESISRVLLALDCDTINDISGDAWGHILFCFFDSITFDVLLAIFLALLARRLGIFGVLLDVLIFIIPDLFFGDDDEPPAADVDEFLDAAFEDLDHAIFQAGTIISSVHAIGLSIETAEEIIRRIELAIDHLEDI